jgi:hypothetical protein
VKRGQPHIKINRSFVNLNGLYRLVKDAGRYKMCLYLHTDLSKRARNGRFPLVKKSNTGYRWVCFKWRPVFHLSFVVLVHH